MMTEEELNDNDDRNRESPNGRASAVVRESNAKRPAFKKDVM
jgi:hypothetical protein